MRARSALRLFVMVLAGTLVLLLVVGVPALWGPASLSRAADYDPSVIATISMGDDAIGPSGVAVNLTTNRIYTANEYSDNVSVIDGDTNTMVATLSLFVGYTPLGVAVNPITNRIYVANAGVGDVWVIDGYTNTVVADVFVGEYPCGVAVNPTTNRIYTANHLSDDVSVIDGDTNTVVATVPVGTWPSGVAVNPTTNRIYTANSSSNSDDVSVIDGDTNTVVATVPVGDSPEGVAVNPTTNRIYTVNSSDVSVIDGDTNTVVATVPVGSYSYPFGVAVNPTTNRIYATNPQSNNVWVIDGGTNTVVATVPVGTWPHGVSASPTTNRIYTADTGDSTVSVIQDSPNTPGGSNVTVVLNGGLGSIGGMQAAFSSVTASGDTSVDVGSSGPPAPTAYRVVGIAGQPAYFDISTTATFSGPVTVCISYDETQVTAPESGLKLMHYVGAEFVDITGSVDAVNNVICGETTSLSPFAIVEPAQPAPSVGGIADLPDVPAAHLEGSPSGGSRIPVSEEVAAALAAGVVVLGVGGWYAKGRWQNARGK